MEKKIKEKKKGKWVVSIKKQKWEFKNYSDAKERVKKLMECNCSFFKFGRIINKRFK